VAEKIDLLAKGWYLVTMNEGRDIIRERLLLSAKLMTLRLPTYQKRRSAANGSSSPQAWLMHTSI